MILSRYVLRTVLGQVLGVSAVLFLIVVVLQFTRVLARAAAERFPTDLLWSIIAWGAAQNIAVIVPMGLALGIVLALGRLHEDHEIAAMDACGAGGPRITLPIVALVCIGSGLLALLSLVYNPYAAAQTDAHKAQALLRSSYLNPRGGEFRTFDGGRLVLYAEAVHDDGQMDHVFAYREDEASETVVVARSGRIERTLHGLPRELVLKDGSLYRITGQGLKQRIVHFDEQRIGMHIPVPNLGPTRADARSTGALLRSSDSAELAELHGRLAQPLMALVLGCLAIRISHLRPRQSRYSSAALLVLVYFGYSSLLTAGEAWIASGRTPIWLGLWWLHGSVVLLAWLADGVPLLVRRRGRLLRATRLTPS